MAVAQLDKRHHLLMAVVWLLLAISVAALFSVAQLPPLRFTICAFLAATIVGLSSLRVSALSLLPRFYVLLYALPFIATLGYLFDSEYVFWQSPAAVRLCQDHDLINDMLTIAIVGLFGLLGGIELGTLRWKRTGHYEEKNDPQRTVSHRTLRVWQFAVLLASAMFLSWLSAPEKSVFLAAYASVEQGSTSAKNMNFNASFLVSYIILILLYLDAQRERGQRKPMKILALLVTTMYIVIVLQLMRGDRDSGGLIAGLSMIYLSRPRAGMQWLRAKVMQRNKVFRIGLLLSVLVVVYVAVGSWRGTAHEQSVQGSVEVYEITINGLRQSTWTSVALNNLGLAAEYDSGSIEYFHGQTYIDYVLSLPPGPIARAFGYTRPLERATGPNWWYTGLSTGGMHPAIVPFKNFGILGTLLILVLIGGFLARRECKATTDSIYDRLMYGATGVSGFLWFWYGDMNIIRALMIALLLYFIYRLCLMSRSKGYRRVPLTAPTRVRMSPRRTTV